MPQVVDIFNFLKEFNLLTNPVITEIYKQKWHFSISEVPEIDEVESIFHGNVNDDTIYLKITKPIIDPCPKPKDGLLEWINCDWQDLSTEFISHRDLIVRETQDQNGLINDIEELFEDDDKRIESYNQWTLERDKWREKQLPKKKGLDIYNSLFRLYSDIKKESESVELIMGDGIITWLIDGRIIDHPVLLQKVELEFDPETPMFTVKCDEIKTEIYTAMLRVINSVNSNMVTDILQDVETENYSLHDKENTRVLFQRLIHILDGEGEYVEEVSKRKIHAQIRSNPVLFLRKRTLGYSEFLESVIDEIREKGDSVLPEFFNTMIGNHSGYQNETKPMKEWNYNGIDKDVLLTLPANNEQLKIIKYLEEYGAVLVQGPPGTGKTHTIANLIGHLLSQGNSVLVTSHTEKALTVLKEKVYKDPKNKEINLQNLCISLLSSKSQKNEMDEAINEIAIKRSSLNVGESEKKINRLLKEREDLIEKSRSKFEELLEIRSLEYKDIVYDNETIKPIEAAKFIKSGEDELNIIPGKTATDTIGLPLSLEEVFFLYESNHSITEYEEALFELELPELENLWDEDYFKQFINDLNNLELLTNNFQPSLVFKDSKTLNECESIIDDAKDLLNELNGFSELQKYILECTIRNPLYEEEWENFLYDFETFISKYHAKKKIEFDYDFTYDLTLLNVENLKTLEKIISTGKEVPVTKMNTLINRKWYILKNGIVNDGHIIQNLDEYKAIYELFAYELEKQRLRKKANKLIVDTEYQIDFDDKMIEFEGMKYKELIQHAASWHKSKWQHFCDSVSEFLLSQKYWKDSIEINMSEPYLWMKEFIDQFALKELTYNRDKISLNNKSSEIGDYISYLEKFQNQHELLDRMIDSTKKHDAETYVSVYQVLKSVAGKFTELQKRKSIIDKISILAPEWAVEIKNRKGIHGCSEPPQNLEGGWKWRQLVNQIERIDSYDPNIIQNEINRINSELLRNARELAHESAWLNKITNIGDEQMQAIEGWRSTIKQIGKGTGKRAHLLRKRARELMPLCQTAIPVWIMPITRVVESFKPSDNKFDVVIIDEASQSDILALSAMYLGKKIIIVGDDEQVSPSNVGIKNEELDGLINMHLKGIPNNHLYNGQTSLYDIAKTAGFEPLMLTEHFRCLPEIIEFSNKLSYNGRIKPLRDSSRISIKPPVVECRVKNGFKDNNKVNKEEATYIASLVCGMVEDPAYKEKSIGVISMQGDKQAYEIDRIIQSYIDPVEYERRRIQCGTSPQFQGDERDVIILSLVDSPNEQGGPIRLLSEDGNNDRTRKRYNVAASRAKDQMWVVHSLNPEIDLKPDDIRLRLIKHAQNVLYIEEDIRLNKVESPFEEEVMRFLINKGYNVIPQMRVGSYRIDMVVEDADNRMAIECDGEKWHTSEDLPNDLKRQAILERLGWRFIRIRGSSFYRNPDQTMHNVIEELSRNEIKPNYNLSGDNSLQQSNDNNEIVRRVKNKAMEIRMEWDPNKYDSNLSGENELEMDNISEASDVELENFTRGLDSNNLSADHLLQSTSDANGSKINKMKNGDEDNIRKEQFNILIDEDDFEKREIDATIGIKDEGFKKGSSGSDENTKRIPIFDFRENATISKPVGKKHKNKVKDKTKTTKSKRNPLNDKETASNFNSNNLKAPQFDFRDN